MEPDTLVPALIGLFALVLPFALIFLFSRFSGWAALADRYPARGPAPRPRHRFGYGVFRGWIGYNGGLHVASDERGIDLRAMPILLSFCHPPIFIPWSAIREIRRGRRLWSSVFEIHLIGLGHVDFALRPGTFAWIRDHARQAGVSGDYD